MIRIVLTGLCLGGLGVAGLIAAAAVFCALEFVMDRAGRAWCATTAAAWVAVFFVVVALYLASVAVLIEAGKLVVGAAA